MSIGPVAPSQSSAGFRRTSVTSQVQPGPQLGELGAEQQVRAVPRVHDQAVRTRVGPVRGGTQHAHHRGDPDPARDQHEPGAGHRVRGERAVRAVHPHRRAAGQLAQPIGEVAGVPHRELDPPGLVGAGGDGERVLLHRVPLQAQPRELAGAEPRSGVPATAVQDERADRRVLRPHDAHPHPALVLEHATHAPAQHQHRDEQQAEPGEHDAHQRVGHHVAEPQHVQRGPADDGRGQDQVHPPPHLVRLRRPVPPQCEQQQHAQRDRAQRGGLPARRGDHGQQQCDTGRVGGDHAGQVHRDGGAGQHTELPVQVQQRLQAQRPAQPAHPRRQGRRDHQCGQRDQAGDLGELVPQRLRAGRDHPDQRRTGEHRHQGRGPDPAGTAVGLPHLGVALPVPAGDRPLHLRTCCARAGNEGPGTRRGSRPGKMERTSVIGSLPDRGAHRDAGVRPGAGRAAGSLGERPQLDSNDGTNPPSPEVVFMKAATAVRVPSRDERGETRLIGPAP